MERHISRKSIFLRFSLVLCIVFVGVLGVAVVVAVLTAISEYSHILDSYRENNVIWNRYQLSKIESNPGSTISRIECTDPKKCSSAVLGDEYVCTGTCICKDYWDDDLLSRRVIPVALHRSVLFVGVSLSAFMAVDAAREYFSQECAMKIPQCDVSKLDVTVESCSKVNTNEIEDDEVFKEKEEEFEGGIETRLYYCEGFCLENNKLKKEETIKEMKEKKCEFRRTYGKVEVPVPTNTRGYNYKYPTNTIAKKWFSSSILSPFCKESSLYIWEQEYFPPTQKTGKKKKYSVSLCSASTNFGDFKNYKNIKCRYLDLEKLGDDPITRSPWRWEKEIPMEEFNE